MGTRPDPNAPRVPRALLLTGSDLPARDTQAPDPPVDSHRLVGAILPSLTLPIARPYISSPPPSQPYIIRSSPPSVYPRPQQPCCGAVVERRSRTRRKMLLRPPRARATSARCGLPTACSPPRCLRSSGRAESC
eukprot:scaffold55078_cov73-Phaeocystis_antarctica.AAC.3